MKTIQTEMMRIRLGVAVRLIVCLEAIESSGRALRRGARRILQETGRKVYDGLDIFGRLVPILFRLFMRRHKGWLILGATSAIVLMIFSNMVDESRSAYQYSYQGRVLGVVKTEDQVLNAIKELQGTEVEVPVELPDGAVSPEAAATLEAQEADEGVTTYGAADSAVSESAAADGSDAYTAESDDAGTEASASSAADLNAGAAAGSSSGIVKIEIDEPDIVIEPVTLPTFTETPIDTQEDVENNLVSEIVQHEEARINAWEIRVNGSLLGILAAKEDADGLLQDVTDYFLADQDRSIFEEIGFAEDVEVNEVQIYPEDLGNRDEMYTRILEGTMNVKTYTVKDGDSLWSIAIENNVAMEDIADWNPQYDFPMIHPGDVLSLQEETSLISVRTLEEAHYETDIPFEIIYTDTDSLYEGEEEVVVAGTVGRKDVIGDIVRINGREVDRIEKQVVVLEEPSTQTALRGTKPVPPRIGTGTFTWPIAAGITSRYGTRWGRLHAGVDFGAGVGTNVTASDGGQVIFVGYDGGYGLEVKIDHGGGYTTLYAHLSQALVSVGDMVFQGQHIAESGNTGSSTGPHLHFGVYKFGVSIDPLGVLG